MQLVLILIWAASTIDIANAIQLGDFRLSGLLWIGASYCITLRLLYYRTSNLSLQLHRNAWLLMAIIYLGLRSLDSENILYAVVDIQSLILPLTICLLVYDSVNCHDDSYKIEKTILKSIFVSIGLLAIGMITGLSTFVEGVGQKGFIGARSVSLYGITVLSISLAVLIYDHKNSAKTRLALIASGVCFFNTFATLSRTALLSSFVILLVAGFLTMSIKNFIRSFAFLAFVVIIALLWEPMSERLMPKDAESLEDVVQSGEFTSGRALLWAFIVNEGMQQPLMGEGTGNVKKLIENNMRSSGILPHNEYLRFFYDGGLIGLSIMCMVLLSRVNRHLVNWRIALKQSDFNLAKWNLASLLATLSMATSAVFDNVFLYQFMLCIVFALYGVTDKLTDMTPVDLENGSGHSE